MTLAEKYRLERKYIESALQIISDFQEPYAKTIPCLNHGDYGCKHLLAKDNKIVGVIDWGEARSDSPIADFANWDYWFGEKIPTNWLKEGYQNKAIFDSDFDTILHNFRIMKELEIFGWYGLQGFEHGLQRAARKLVEDLKYFE